MQDILSILKKHVKTIVKLLPMFAFLVSIVLLYFLNPTEPYLTFDARASFELMWKGRTFQLFFIWLLALELTLDWESLQENRINKLVSVRTLAFIVVLALPTIYVIIANYYGLNAVIAASARQSGVQWWNLMPLSTEYFVFVVLFCLMVLLPFGTKGLKSFSVPLFFLAAVGALYTIDNFYPYGQFTPFQFLVPTTTTLSAAVLNLMGYNTTLTTQTDPIQGTLPLLTAVDPNNPSRNATFAIAWPCAGIESLLIFTVVALLFLKRMPISWKVKTGYFAIGATVTYTINILRIVAFFPIGMDYGVNSEQVRLFHFYYGPLYSITWIVSYPLIILGIQALQRKITVRKNSAAIIDGY